MSLARQLTRGLRALVRGRTADHDVDDEVAHYLEQSTADRVAHGMTAIDAHRAALLEIGNTTVVREQVRSSGWEHLAETAVADIRYAFRGLARNAGFTATAVITLALGIGASTAVFSAVSPILIEPLQFPH